MKNEGFCLHCARELHIKPVEDLMKQFGMSDEDMDNMENRMESMMDEMGDANPLSLMMNMGQPMEGGESEGDDDLAPGSSETFPLGVKAEGEAGNGKKAQKNGKKPPRRKFLDTYCENLTRKAREGRLDDIVEKSLQGAAIWDEVKDRLNKSALGMSGGQQQRVAIARALIAKPDVIFADEPTGNLDSQSGREVMDLLASVHREFGKTIVVITHDDRIAQKAERKISIVDGILSEVSRR